MKGRDEMVTLVGRERDGRRAEGNGDKYYRAKGFGFRGEERESLEM